MGDAKLDMHHDLGCVVGLLVQMMASSSHFFTHNTHHLPTQVQGRQETDEALLECCRSWLQLASSCYGPHGRQVLD